MLEQSVVQKVLGAALRTGGEWAEVFVEDKQQSSGRLDDGRIEELSSLRDRGAGIRVVVGDTTGFAHTADLSEAGLRLAAEAASAVARSGGGGTREVALTTQGQKQINDIKVMPESVEKAAKVAILRRADDAARGVAQSITQVNANYADVRRRIMVANSDGLLASDDQVRASPSPPSPAATPGCRPDTSRPASRWVGNCSTRSTSRASPRRPPTAPSPSLKARPAPSGAVPVVLAKGSGGVMFHEACGHGLEADAVLKKTTVFAGRVGELVASPLVTLVDDGTMGPEWGSFSIDDEGRPATYNVLIKDGVLTDYMWDFLRARKEGRETSSGNGRRQGYDYLPMVRMTNTYVLAGQEDPDEIIRQTPTGVFVAHLGGGQVNPATGDFVFGMTEAYLIENGEITEPIRDANLIGNGPEVLKNIDVVGKDFAMGGPGMCGKSGQSVPVGDGQPTLRVTAITVGGTAA